MNDNALAAKLIARTSDDPIANFALNSEWAKEARRLEECERAARRATACTEEADA